MLFAVAGSQGSGKSTLLRALADAGYRCTTRKTSRSILSDWNVSLAEVNSNPELTIRFQDEILNRKYQDELDAVKSNDVWFTERTYADLFTYALIALGKDNQYSDWLDQYYTKCALYTAQYHDIFYLAGGLFPVEHDGVRGSNAHYGRMVDTVMLDITKQMTAKLTNKVHVITAVDLDRRVSILDEYVQTVSSLRSNFR